jgi:hypothetical protein
MIGRALSTFGLLLIAGCTTESPRQSPEATSSALAALTARDDAALAQCGRAVEQCEEQRPDAAPAAVCDRLAEHCGQLLEHLSELREPAVGCLRRVEACAEHAPEQAQCTREASVCEPVAEAAAEDGQPVIYCSERVEDCLTRIAELPDAAAVSCENIAAACERVAALSAQASDARARGAENASEIAQRAREAAHAIDGQPGAASEHAKENPGRPADAGAAP